MGGWVHSSCDWIPECLVAKDADVHGEEQMSQRSGQERPEAVRGPNEKQKPEKDEKEHSFSYLLAARL